MKVRKPFIPTPAKGDIQVRDAFGRDIRLPAGTDGQILALDPEEPLGMKWADTLDVAGGVFTVTFLTGGPQDWVWPSMFLNEAFLFNDSNTVVQADLSRFTECRLLVNQQASGVDGAILELRYCTSYALLSSSFLTIGTSIVQAILSTGNPAMRTSAWIPLLGAAKAEVFLGIVGSGGNNSASPKFGPIHAQFR